MCIYEMNPSNLDYKKVSYYTYYVMLVVLIISRTWQPKLVMKSYLWPLQLELWNDGWSG